MIDISLSNESLIEYFRNKLKLGYPTEYSINPYLRLVYSDLSSKDYNRVYELVTESSYYRLISSNKVPRSTIENISFRYNDRKLKFDINFIRDYSNRSNTVIITNKNP